MWKHQRYLVHNNLGQIIDLSLEISFEIQDSLSPFSIL